MDHKLSRQVGRTSLRLPRMGFGGATLGDPHAAIPEHQALATIEAAYSAGISYFDTSPWYGNGKSEHRFGAVLRAKPRDSFVLTTKVGRVYAPSNDSSHPAQQRWRGGLPFNPVFDYSKDGILRSYEQSLLRLGLHHVDALIIHDLDEGHHGTVEAVESRIQELEHGGFAALEGLKASGEIAAIGVGVNRLGTIPRFLHRFAVDFFLLAMPYTLVNQEALGEELPQCEARGTSIVIGAPFASGILASGPVRGATYGYRAAPDEAIERVRQIAEVCERHQVPLGAAALQFPLAHPAVASVIPGPSTPDQVAINLQWMNQAIPSGLWDDLKSRNLLRSDAPVPARENPLPC